MLDILQFRWNSLVLFPVIVGKYTSWLFQPEVEQDRKKVKLECIKKVLMTLFLLGVVGLHTFIEV
jgi:hypothetical protein